MLSGNEIQSAFKKASAWRTPVVAGVGDGILLLPATPKRSQEFLKDDSLGIDHIKEGSPGLIKVGGDIPGYLRYDGMDVLLAMVMGDVGAPTQQGATTAYANSFKLKSKIDGIFGTFVQKKGDVNIDEYTSVKVFGFTIKGEEGQPLSITFNIIANEKIYNSSINTSATFANVTYVETGYRIHFSQGIFRLADRSTSVALMGGDQVNPSAFELVYKRPVTSSYEMDGTNQITEPSNDGKPECILSLTFPRYTATTYMLDFGNDQRKMADMVFTGAQIATPYNREFKIQLPHLVIRDTDNANAQGKIVQPVEFDCLGVDVAAAGMTGILTPFQIDVINQRATDPLA